MKKNKEKLSKKEKRKKSVIFLLKFFLIFSVLHYLIYLIDTDFLQQFITDFASNALNLPSQGLFIYINAQPFFISKSCTGLISSFILAAIIFSLKKPEIEKKIAMYLAGTIILLIANVFRVIFVLWMGILFGIQAAELTHVISWFAMSALIIALWYYSSLKLLKIKNFSGFL